MPVHLVPLKPSFSKWYNGNVRCDYHAGNLDHSTENCSALRHMVRDLIKDGKLKFEESNGLARVEDSSRAKAEVIRQENKAPIEASFEKVIIPKDEVSIAKDKKGETSGSLTTERSKE